MKKSLFVFGAALMAGTSAFAMDVSNPFYLPMEGDYLSDTTVLYQNANHGNVEGMIGLEGLSYGITDNLTGQITVADNWYFNMPENDPTDNPSWIADIKYNLFDDCNTNWKAQLIGSFSQGGFAHALENPFSTIANHHMKTIIGSAKVGYQLDHGLLPYITATIEKQVGHYVADPSYIVRAALYDSFDANWSAELGGTYRWANETYDFSDDFKGTKDRGHFQYWALDAAVNYAFSDCMTVGLKGSYMLDAKPNNIDFYTVGMNFKVAF